MSDDTLHVDLHCALRLEPNPGLTERMTQHALRAARGEVWPPPRRIPLRAVAMTLAVATAFAATGVYVVQHRSGSHVTNPPSALGTPPAIVAGGSPSPTATSTVSPTAVANAQGPPDASPTPVPDCQAADVVLSVNTAGTYVVGSNVPAQETITNFASHPCLLPDGCSNGWTATDSQGRLVGHSVAAACAIGLPRQALQHGQSTTLPGYWDTDRVAPGTYTVTVYEGYLPPVTARVTLVPPPTSTPSPSPSPTATPLLP